MAPAPLAGECGDERRRSGEREPDLEHHPGQQHHTADAHDTGERAVGLPDRQCCQRHTTEGEDQPQAPRRGCVRPACRSLAMNPVATPSRRGRGTRRRSQPRRSNRESSATTSTPGRAASKRRRTASRRAARRRGADRLTERHLEQGDADEGQRPEAPWRQRHGHSETSADRQQRPTRRSVEHGSTFSERP